MKRLTLDNIKIPKPDFSASKLTKGQLVFNWLIEWIKNSLECGIADIGDFIPTKEDLALYLAVSAVTAASTCVRSCVPSLSAACFIRRRRVDRKSVV